MHVPTLRLSKQQPRIVSDKIHEVLLGLYMRVYVFKVKKDLKTNLNLKTTRKLFTQFL